jgi:hypothetical protein
LFTFREAGTQVSPVMMSHPSLCLPLDRKDSLEDNGGFCFGGFCFGLLAFGCGRLLEGKRIAKGELLASLRAEALRKLKREYGTVEVSGAKTLTDMLKNS